MSKLAFQIYVSNKTLRNQNLIRFFKDACLSKLNEKDYEVEVFDLSKNPQLAETCKILATPTICRSRPAPEKRVIGNLNAEGALEALNFLIDDLTHKPV